MTATISILLPTRGRSDQLVKSVQSLFEHIDDMQGIEVLLGIDNDDTVGFDAANTQVRPYLQNLGVPIKIFMFEPMGYHRLHEYLNELALQSKGDWMFFWNDDAVMSTQGWDTQIRNKTGEFKLLSVITHNEHPYSIFPIIPRQWHTILGYLSQHSLNDAWVSHIAYYLDIFERIPVWVEHDRHDLTGNNNDDTYQRRKVLEGNPADPEDFNNETIFRRRLDDAAKIATWMQDQNMDCSWFANILQGRQDPWEKLNANDPNKQVAQQVSQ